MGQSRNKYWLFLFSIAGLRWRIYYIHKGTIDVQKGPYLWWGNSFWLRQGAHATEKKNIWDSYRNIRCVYRNIYPVSI